MMEIVGPEFVPGDEVICLLESQYYMRTGIVHHIERSPRKVDGEFLYHVHFPSLHTTIVISDYYLVKED